MSDRVDATHQDLQATADKLRAELERWKRAAGEYYQAKERHRATLEEIRRHLFDPTITDTARVIRAQGTLTGKDTSTEVRT